MQVFCTAYRHVDPSLYMSMQHLFWTWRGVFPPVPLRTIETELQLNPKPVGPGTGSQPSRAMEPPVRPGHGIHVNPKYLEQRQLLQQSRTRRVCISYLPILMYAGCVVFLYFTIATCLLWKVMVGRCFCCVPSVRGVYFPPFFYCIDVCSPLLLKQADGVAAAERNGDGQARQDQAAPRENSKVWSETQRSTVRIQQ